LNLWSFIDQRRNNEMTGFSPKVSEIKKERLRKLTSEGLPTRIIAERLGLNSSQVNYHQKKLGIWKGEKRK